MSSYVLQLPKEESVVLSGPAVQALIDGGSGDAALLYLAVLKNKGSIDDKKVCAALRWTAEQFQRALFQLSAQGLIAASDGEKIPPPPLPEPPQRAEDRRTEYTRADIARALEDQAFSGLADAVEQKLGKKLTTPNLAALLGLYDQLGLPLDVIYLLVNFCAERTAQQYGKGRQPNMRQIEKEGYVWAKLGIMNQESAAAYIRKCQQRQQALPRMMRLLRLGDRAPSPSEEKFLLEWMDMGFEDKAIELAYDKTILNCKELRWPYMHKILNTWNGKGLHTLEQVEAEDKPVRQRRQTGKSAPDSAQEEIARMEKYREKLRREMEES